MKNDLSTVCGSDPVREGVPVSTSPPPNPHDQAEIRLMGLILMQSITIGIAVGVYDSELWLTHSDPMINAMTYSMGAFAMQGLAYYVFKMFFQQGMDEKARMTQMERERRTKYTGMQQMFEQRRQDMELRMQQMQMEAELKWLEANPGKMPSWMETRIDNPGVMGPTVAIGDSQPLDLGISFGEEKEETEGESDSPSKERNSDGTFKKKGD